MGPAAQALGFAPGQVVERDLRSPLFFDLTLSLSKSVSIFHASMGEQRAPGPRGRDADGEGY